MERKALKFEIKKDDIAGRVFSGYASTFDVDLGGEAAKKNAKNIVHTMNELIKSLSDEI